MRGLRDRAEVAERLASTRVVSVMDRDADFFDRFAELQQLGGLQLLGRAKHNRNRPPPARKQGRPKLFDWMRDQPGQARLAIEVARVSERVSTLNQSAHKLRVVHCPDDKTLAGGEPAQYG